MNGDVKAEQFNCSNCGSIMVDCETYLRMNGTPNWHCPVCGSQGYWPNRRLSDPDDLDMWDGPKPT